MQAVLTAMSVLTRLARLQAQTTLEWEAPPWPGRVRLLPLSCRDPALPGQVDLDQAAGAMRRIKIAVVCCNGVIPAGVGAPPVLVSGCVNVDGD